MEAQNGKYFGGKRLVNRCGSRYYTNENVDKMLD